MVKSPLSSAKITSTESITSQRFLESQSNMNICSFYGEKDYIEAADWIELYDRISTDYNWTTANKIIRLGGHLRKHALVWYVKTLKLHPIETTTWSEYKDLFITQYKPINLERPSSKSSDVSSVSSSVRS